MKHKIKALLATSVLAVSLLLALLVYPSSGADRANFVFAAQFPTETTRITNAGLYYGSTQMAFFTADGQTAYAEVGQKIDNIYTTVELDAVYTSFPGNFDEANAFTRVYCTISHPTAGTIFAGYVTTRQMTLRANEYYILVGWDNFSEHTLIAGTYTLTTLYQIYA